ERFFRARQVDGVAVARRAGGPRGPVDLDHVPPRVGEVEGQRHAMVEGHLDRTGSRALRPTWRTSRPRSATMGRPSYFVSTRVNKPLSTRAMASIAAGPNGWSALCLGLWRSERHAARPLGALVDPRTQQLDLVGRQCWEPVAHGPGRHLRLG